MRLLTKVTLSLVLLWGTASAQIDYASNFGKATVSTGYTSSATTIVLTSGQGARLPNPTTYGAYNLVWYNASTYNDPADAYWAGAAEIIRVTARSGDTLTISRAQEGTTARNMNTQGKVYKVIFPLTANWMNTVRDSTRVVYAAQDSSWTSISTNTINPASGTTTTIPQNLTVTGTAAIDSVTSTTFTMRDDATVDSTLTVKGTSTLTGNVTASGNLTVTGTAAIDTVTDIRRLTANTSSKSVIIDSPDTLRAWWIKTPDPSRSDSTRTDIYGGSVVFHQPFNSPPSSGLYFYRGGDTNSMWTIGLDVGVTERNPYFYVFQDGSYSGTDLEADVFTISPRRYSGANSFRMGSSVGGDTTTTEKLGLYVDLPYGLNVQSADDYTGNFTGLSLNFRHSGATSDYYGLLTTANQPRGNRQWHWIMADSLVFRIGWERDWSDANKNDLSLYDIANSKRWVTFDSAGVYVNGVIYTEGNVGINTTPSETYALSIANSNSITTTGVIYSGNSYWKSNSMAVGGSPWGGSTTTIASLTDLDFRVSPSTGNVQRLVINDSLSRFYDDVNIDSTLVVDGNLTLSGSLLGPFSASTSIGVGLAGDTANFETTAVYPMFYNETDTIVVEKLRAVLQGSTPSLTVDIQWHATLGSASSTHLNSSPPTITSVTTGDTDTSFDETDIPPGVYVWYEIPTLTTKPTGLTIDLNGYTK